MKLFGKPRDLSPDSKLKPDPDPKEELARRVSQLAHLDDPGVQEFPNDLEGAMKKVLETILLPDPNDGPGNGFSDELDCLVGERLLTEIGMTIVDSPFQLGTKYSQVKVVLRYVSSFRKKGWQAEITAYHHDGKDGKVTKVTKTKTGVYQRRTEALLEAMVICTRAKSEFFAGA